MKPKEQFNDELKKSFFKNYPSGYFGYNTNDGRLSYQNYLSNDEFDKFKQEMKQRYPDIFSAYEKGQGNEFKEKKNKNQKIVPPKMASIASSSRLTYLTFRNNCPKIIEKITGSSGAYEMIFEGTLNSIIGNHRATPNIDVILKTDTSIVFIEVKCQEIFDSHSNSFSDSYKSSLEIIFDNNQVANYINKKGQNLLKVKDLESYKRFSIKQTTVLGYLAIQTKVVI